MDLDEMRWLLTQLDALLAFVLDEDPVCQGDRTCTKHTFSK